VLAVGSIPEHTKIRLDLGRFRISVSGIIAIPFEQRTGSPSSLIRNHR
jgi:hypothetical protein